MLVGLPLYCLGDSMRHTDKWFPAEDDDAIGGLNPIACTFAAFAVYVALAVIWIFRADIFGA